jgi:hypothetical protein
MTIETMKQALEALEEAHPKPYNESVISHVEAITALRTAIAEAEKQEPVAWMHTMIDDVVVGHRPADLNVHPDRWMPLYKDPTPCQTCEALARTVMMDQTAHDTQRQPLTEERVWELAANCLDSVAGRLQFARAIEAAHGITGEKPDAS